MVYFVAVDPQNPSTLYTVEAPAAGGSAAFRRDDDGRWTSITDSLQQADPTISPTCIAVHPLNSNYVYLGTSSGAVYVSSTRGSTWGPPQILGGRVVQIIVDPRNALNPATTVIYAGTWNGGVYRSTDGGATWGSPVVGGWVTSMAFHMPATGTAHFYVGMMNEGIFHTTDPTTGWTNLNNAGVGLPPWSNYNFVEERIAFCQNNPNRVYVWLANYGGSLGLYTTSTPPTGWSQVMSASLPNPGQGLYSFALAAAPNSPGDGVNDILLFASTPLYRSIDAGHTWAAAADWYHADQHAFAFVPSGTIPITLVGCDGGLVASTRFADPTYNIASPPTDFSDGTSYAASGVAQNYNHGKLSTALRHYGADPSVAAVGYIGCQDTGIAAHTSALGWRGLADADGVAVATTPGADGVKVWSQVGYPFSTFILTDHGDFAPTFTNIQIVGSGGDGLNSTSNHMLTIDRKCVTGARPLTSSSTPVTTTGVQTVTPQSMAYITSGSLMFFDTGPATEIITVSSTTATSFSANFSKTHAAGVMIDVFQSFVVSIDQSGNATQISQVFGQNSPQAIAGSLVDPTFYCCATQDQRVWITRGVPLGPGTVWSEATGNKPANLSISSVAIDPMGNVYALLTRVPGGSQTPLYQISGGNWIPQPSSGLPTWPFGSLVADPIAANTLYAASGGRVYRLVKSGATWNWTDISAGLPGPLIQDLWIGNIGTTGSPKVLLRAAVASRGMWETDVTAGVGDPPSRPYVRDHFLDQGWLLPSPDGLVNPFSPGDGVSVFHYQCADIKIDARQPGAMPFYQTDPEGALPLSHVLFDQLRDNSQNLPQTDAAYVHVQVHNRSNTPINNVNVWAVYCSASGGVPGLNVSPSQGNNFLFWSQFQPGGAIVPNLPADSPWTSVGPPRSLSNIDAAHPQVASWNWTIPTLPSGDPGHYCMVVFLHSGEHPINETGYNVDAITPANPQVGQKNLHIGPPLPASPRRGGPGGHRMEEYIEFHNPTPKERVTDLVFDLRPLSPALRAWFRLTELDTVAPLEQSLTGIEAVHRPGPTDEARKALLEGVELSEAVLHWLDRWLDRVEAKLGGEAEEKRCPPKRRPGPRFTPPVYRAKPSALIEVKGVRLGAFRFGAALLVIENRGELPEGSEYRFQVQQRMEGQVVGGSVYVVRIAGQPELPPPIVTPSHQIDAKTGRPRVPPPLHLANVPPWMAEIVEEREEELGKRPPERDVPIGFRRRGRPGG
jgi:hypothetical protein